MPVTMERKNIVKVSELHKDTAKYIEMAQEHPVFIFRYGEPELVLVSIQLFEQLQEQIAELEELVDRLELKADLEKRRKETKGKITLEELRAQHGLL